MGERECLSVRRKEGRRSQGGRQGVRREKEEEGEQKGGGGEERKHWSEWRKEGMNKDDLSERNDCVKLKLSGGRERKGNVKA